MHLLFVRMSRSVGAAVAPADCPAVARADRAADVRANGNADGDADGSADDRASDAHADDCVADDGTLHSGAVLHVGLVRQARRLVLLLGRLMRRRRGR